jgi:hypothetical protein
MPVWRKSKYQAKRKRRLHQDHRLVTVNWAYCLSFEVNIGMITTHYLTLVKLTRLPNWESFICIYIECNLRAIDSLKTVRNPKSFIPLKNIIRILIKFQPRSSSEKKKEKNLSLFEI